MLRLTRMTVSRFALAAVALWPWIPERLVAAQADQQVVAVFRVSRQMFEDVVNQEFGRSMDVNMCVLDARCVGRANVTGAMSADFTGTSLEEPLIVDVQGDIQSRATGYTKAFKAGACTAGRFHVQVGFDFDGTKFVQEPTRVSISFRSNVTWVDTRGRLGRRLVRRLGPRFAPRMVPPYDCEAARLAKLQVIEAVDEGIQPLLEELNQAVELEQALADLAARQGYQRRVTKTPDYLQVRVAPEHSDRAPPEKWVSDAPIEIWVYPSAGRPDVATAIMRLQKAQEALGPLLPEAVQPPESLGQRLKIQPMGDWDLLQVYVTPPPLLEDALQDG